MPKLILDKYNEGVAAYERGDTVRVIAENVEAKRQRGLSALEQADWRDEEAKEYSFILGFVSGLVEDVRRAAGKGRGLRA